MVQVYSEMLVGAGTVLNISQVDRAVAAGTNYLECDKVICCGGSWMVKGDLIKAGEFNKIREMTKEAIELAKTIRA